MIEVCPWRRWDATEAQWNDWRWQQRKAVRSLEGLQRFLNLQPEEIAGIEESYRRFPPHVTPYYLSLADPEDQFCPVRMQIIPRLEEALVRPGELEDPLAEDRHQPVAGLVHRYPDRVLYLALDRCSMHCRHCTRRRFTGKSHPFRPLLLDDAVDYVREHREIRDVLISGGDPFLFSTNRLERILSAFRAIPQVEILRIGTRMPVSNPMRIDGELCRVLRRYSPLYVMTHFNHPKELTPRARVACEALVDAGVPVENQAVLIRRLNSSARIMIDLCRGLLKARIKPYYMHQMDVAQGLEHLRTPIEQGVEILRAQRDMYPGWRCHS